MERAAHEITYWLETVLQFYDVNKPVIVSVDASKDGVGACIFQKNFPCALNASEENNVVDDLDICVINVSFSLSDKKFEELIEATSKDYELLLVKKIVKEGWPSKISKVPSEIKYYYKFRDEII